MQLLSVLLFVRKIIEGSDFADYNSWMGHVQYLTTSITYLTPVHIHSTRPTDPAEISGSHLCASSVTKEQNQLVCSDFTVLLLFTKSLPNLDLPLYLYID